MPELAQRNDAWQGQDNLKRPKKQEKRKKGHYVAINVTL